MIAKRAGVVHPVPFAAHHLKEVVERGLHNDGNVDNDDNEDNIDNNGIISRKRLNEACTAEGFFDKDILSFMIKILIFFMYCS